MALLKSMRVVGGKSLYVRATLKESHVLGFYRSKSTAPSPAPVPKGDTDEYVVKPVESPATEVLGCPVNSHNEFDPLREVIVGCVADATIPEWHVSGKAVWPSKHWNLFKHNAGNSFPSDLIVKAANELDGFARILEAEGVTVRRPGKFSGIHNTLWRFNRISY